MMIAYMNGQYLPEKEASLGITDLSIRRGFGIFDFFRSVGFNPLFIDDHISRFYASSEKINLKIPVPQDEIKRICKKLIFENKIEDSGIRIILTGGYSANGYTPAEPNLIITNEPVKVVSEDVRSKGVKVISHDYQREYPDVKTINYFTGIMKQKEAEAKGAFDILYHDRGALRELTRSNIFIVDENNNLLTPANKILKGITRKNVIQLAKKDFNVEEKDLSMNDLFSAKEVFLTGTTKKILPIIQLDDQIISDGKPGIVSLKLIEEFNTLEAEYKK